MSVLLYIRFGWDGIVSMSTDIKQLHAGLGWSLSTLKYLLPKYFLAAVSRPRRLPRIEWPRLLNCGKLEPGMVDIGLLNFDINTYCDEYTHTILLAYY